MCVRTFLEIYVKFLGLTAKTVLNYFQLQLLGVEEPIPYPSGSIIKVHKTFLILWYNRNMVQISEYDTEFAIAVICIMYCLTA